MRERLDIVLVNDTRVDRHHGCTRVMRTLRSLAASRGLDIIASTPAHADWRTDEAFVAALDRARLVLVNGEGTIHHDRPAGLRLLAVGAEAQRRGIPAALVNASWQANGDEAYAALGAFGLVSVRESLSLAEVTARGAEARRVPDLSLYDDVADTPGDARSGIGVTDSVVRPVAAALREIRAAHGGTPVSMFDFDRTVADRARLLRGAASSALTISGRLRSIAHAWQDAAAMQPTEDGFVDQVRALRLLVTGRFHALCIALAAGTPFLATETNTHKIVGLIGDAELAPWRHLPVGEIGAAEIERASTWSRDEADARDAFLADTRARIETLFDDLRALAA